MSITASLWDARLLESRQRYQLGLAVEVELYRREEKCARTNGRVRLDEHLLIEDALDQHKTPVWCKPCPRPFS